MTRQRVIHRIFVLALSLSAAALLLSSGLPHDHGQSAASHQHACRFCKLQDGFLAAPPATPGSLHLAVAVAVVCVARAVGSPRAVQLARSTPPRAPPRFS